MQILVAAAVLVVALSPALAAAQTQVGPVLVVSGGAAFADFATVSADGCEDTSGQVFVVEAHTEFHLANGLYVSGFRHDVCTGEMNGYGGYAEGSFEVFGLFFAHFAGTVVAESYSGGAPLTVELDLWWIGTGKPTHESGVHEDGPAILFSFKGERAASTFGNFAVDGEPANLSAARLVSETSGQITLP